MRVVPGINDFIWSPFVLCVGTPASVTRGRLSTIAFELASNYRSLCVSADAVLEKRQKNVHARARREKKRERGGGGGGGGLYEERFRQQ